MQWTNKFNVSQPIVDAVKNDPYNKGDCDYSVTELLQPARVKRLTDLHRDEITEDVIDHIWILLGKSVHQILETANTTGIAERRLFADINGIRISGGMDYYHKDGMLRDYKITNTWKIKFSDYKDWESQLNIYRYILHVNNEEVTELEVEAILRDWVKSSAKRDPKYPQAQIARISLPIWDHAKTLQFILERIDAHEKAKIQLPVCTLEERWANKSTNFTRCNGYCPPSKFCDFYQRSIKGEEQCSSNN